MPESTEELESSNDKENIEEQGQKKKVAKKLEEKQDTIEIKTMPRMLIQKKYLTNLNKPMIVWMS